MFKIQDFYLVRNPINPIILIGDWMRESTLCDKLFFIRYNDPDFHIRYRFYFKTKNSANSFFVAFSQYLQKLWLNKYIWKVQIDTYERELERYMLIPILKTEFHFCNESKLLYQYLFYMQSDSDAIKNYELSFYIIDMYFSLLRLSTGEIVDLLVDLSLAFKSEFSFDEYNSKSLNIMYRKRKADSIVRISFFCCF